LLLLWRRPFFIDLGLLGIIGAGVLCSFDGA